MKYKTLLIKLFTITAALFWQLQANGQSIAVTGVVQDVDGPIPGVTVREDGSTNSTLTEDNGQFTITVSSAGATLVFSSIGYEEQRIQVGTDTTLHIQMESVATLLDELVVVGYGQQKKSDIATAIASVDVADMKTFPSGNAMDMLRGQVAGVNVTSTSGRPGSNPSITIRGSRSISAANTPLYIIDGSPSSATEFSTLSPDAIASIEVLKDAASQAIYGARASDGVILVTTKRGQAGKVEVNYNNYVGIQSLWKNFDFYSAEEYLMLRREAKANDNGLVDAREMPISEALDDNVMERVWASGQYIDWEDLMFRNALHHNHDLSVRGGTDKIKVATGLNYLDQQGMVVVGSGYQRYSLRLNVDFKASDYVSFGINSMYGKTVSDREDGNFNDFITSTPLAEIYDENGAYTKYINSDGNYNPFFRAANYGRQITGDNYRLNAFMDVKPTKGLNYRLNASLYRRNAEDGSFRSSEYPGGGSTASLTNSENENMLLENIITYEVPFSNENHNLVVTGVQSIDHNRSKSIGYSVENLPIDRDWNLISQGEFTGKPVRSFSENNLVSFMGRLQYALMDRYLVNVAVRRDASSRFGKANKWGTFPSVALAWKINEENFLQQQQWIDLLKLRLSYGVVGNQNGIGNYTTLGLASNEGYEFGDNFQMGYLPGQELSNPNLKWEQSATTNLGVDFAFWNGRLSGALDLYKTNTENLLVRRTLNASLGYTSMLDNLGKTQSSGIDLSLSGDIVRKPDFSWKMGTNFSLYKNKIIRIDDEVDENGNPLSQVGQGWIIGEPINIYYDYKTDGIFQYDDFDITKDGTGNIVYTLKNTYDGDGDGILDSPIDYGGAMSPGMVKVRDANGDGRISADDRVPIRQDPQFTMSLSSSWTWKGFDLYMEWYGVYGSNKRNAYLYDFNSGGSLSGKLNGVKVDYWTPYNPSNAFPRPSYSVGAPYQSALAIQDGSYIRLRTLQLGYNFSNRVLKTKFIQNFRVYATASNLLTFTEFLSYSPELTPGAYPESRDFVLGVNLSF